MLPSSNQSAERRSWISDLKLVWEFRRYFLPYLLPVVGLLGMAALQMDLLVTGAVTVKQLLDTLAGESGSAATLGTMSGRLAGWVLGDWSPSVLSLAALTALFLTLAQAAAIASQYVRGLVNHNFRQKLQAQIIAALSRETAETRVQRTTGGTNEIFTTDAPGLSMVLVFGIVAALEDLVKIGIGAYSVAQLPNGLELLIVLLPVAVLVQTSIIGVFLGRESRLNDESQRLTFDLRGRTIAFFDVLGRLVYLRGERAIGTDLLQRAARASRAGRKFQLWASIRGGVSAIFTQLTLPMVALIVIAVPVVLARFGRADVTLAITPGDIVAASTLMMSLIASVSGIIDTPATIAMYSPNLRRLKSVLDIPEANTEPPELHELRKQNGPLDIEWRDVTFTYPDAPQPQLRSVSFEVPRGATVGIIGGSGSGKTTIARLLLGDLRPAAGRIYLGGVDVTDWHLLWRRYLVGFLPAEQGFLRGTLEENVLFGRDRTEVRDYERALEASGVAAIAREKQPEGMQFRIERNVEDTLSTGQRRKIGIARLLAGDQPVWIFDEPGSGLDPYSMAELARALPTVTAGRTTLIITHDPDVFLTDFNVFLADGSVAAVGPHERLLRENSAYAQLVARFERERQEPVAVAVGASSNGEPQPTRPAPPPGVSMPTRG
jgi:ABC-type bacteriocin/lantibiotic exporter with double-glycine peptidase domain